MLNKILLTLLISIVLTSCISISRDSDRPIQQDFVTATLAPTAIGLIPATATVLPETRTPDPVIPTGAHCTNAAILSRDVTVPDNTQMKAGEKFTETWEFQNTGTCPWMSYTMKLSSGDSMVAPQSAPIPVTLPNEKVQVSVELTAPSSDGAYTTSFTLNDTAGDVISIGSKKSFWVKIVVGNVLVAQSSPSISVGGTANCAYSENAGYIYELISLINQARAEAGLPALNVNAQLSAAAQGHSVDMACNNFLSHFGSDGSGWWVRVGRAGYPSPSVAEILAIGTPQDAMNQWWAEPGHWEFVMAANTEIGVGYAYYSQSDYGGYFTVDLGG